MKNKILVLLLFVSVLINIVYANNIANSKPKENISIGVDKEEIFCGEDFTISMWYDSLKNGLASLEAEIIFLDDYEYMYSNLAIGFKDAIFADNKISFLYNSKEDKVVENKSLGNITLRLNNLDKTKTSIIFKVKKAVGKNGELYKIKDKKIDLVIKGKDPNCDLLSLIVSNGNLNFSKDILEYNVDLGPLKEKKEVSIMAKTESANAVIENSESLKSIIVEPGQVVKKEILVKAQNGNTKTYIVNFKSEDGRSDEKEIISIETEPKLEFSKTKTDFIANVDYSVSEIKINKINLSPKATLKTKLDVIKLNVGKNEYKINVISEKLNKKEYNLVINRDRDKSMDLQYIEIDGKKIENFDTQITTYTCKVGANEKTVNIDAQLVNKDSIIEGTGKLILEEGTTKHVIKVTAKSGEIKVYVLYFEREKVKQELKRIKFENTYLKNITPNVGNLEPSFKKEIVNYTLTVPEGTKNLEIEALPEKRFSKVKIKNLDKVFLTNNLIEIEVTNGGDEKRIYKVLVVEKTKQTSYTVSKENRLNNILIKEGKLEPKFDKNILNYEVHVPKNTHKLNMLVYRLDNKCFVNISGNKDFKKLENKVTLTVIAENGDEKQYIINAIRDKQDARAKIIIVASVISITTSIAFVTYIVLKNKENEKMLKKLEKNKTNKKMREKNGI